MKDAVVTYRSREAAINRPWVATIKFLGVIVVVAGMALAIYAEWPTIGSGFGDLGRTRWHWVELALASEAISMWAFVLLHRRLLQALGVRLPISGWRPQKNLRGPMTSAPLGSSKQLKSTGDWDSHLSAQPTE